MMDDSLGSANYAKIAYGCSRCCPPSWPPICAGGADSTSIRPRTVISLLGEFPGDGLGEVPDNVIVEASRAVDGAYAEHSFFNASTFAARVVTSTQPILQRGDRRHRRCSRASLRGGANAAVMHGMMEIDAADNAFGMVARQASTQGEVMGFPDIGYLPPAAHSRVPTNESGAGIRRGGQGCGRRWLDIYDVLEKDMYAATGIQPNLDFPTGPAYSP